MGRRLIECSANEIKYILEQYVHSVQDRKVMLIYLTDYPDSLEKLAENCDLSVSTIKRIINRNSFIYKYLP
jgi:predicted transcriptional regulator